MNNLINKILSFENKGDQLSIEDFIKFLIEYSELKELKLSSSQKEKFNKSIPIIIDLFSKEIFDINYVVKNYCRIKNIPIYTLSKNNKIIKRYIL